MLHRLKHPLEAYNKIWLGTIALAIAVVTVVGVVLVDRLALGQARYRAEFAQAAQIRPGDRVTVAGISVGTVAGLALAGDRVIVTLNARTDIHLGADTRAAIKLTTILGSRYIELSPAGSGELAHHRIPLANTAVPYDLQKTLQDATTTFEQVDADRITQSLTVLSQSLGGLPEALPQALNNLKSLAAVISGRRGQIRTLLASADAVTTMIRDQKADLGALVLHGRDLLAQIVTRRAAVQRLFTSATMLADRANAILQDQPAINELIANVQELARLLGDHDALIRNIFQVMPVPLRNLTNAFGSSTAIEANAPAGPFIDSWMCALSGRAKQFGFTEYFQDCQPAPDPWPGWPPPQPERLVP